MENVKIKSVDTVDGGFIVNKSIKVFNIEVQSGAIDDAVYDIEFDEETTNAGEAIQIAESFFNEAYVDVISGNFKPHMPKIVKRQGGKRI